LHVLLNQLKTEHSTALALRGPDLFHPGNKPDAIAQPSKWSCRSDLVRRTFNIKCKPAIAIQKAPGKKQIIWLQCPHLGLLLVTMIWILSCQICRKEDQQISANSYTLLLLEVMVHGNQHFA
jgi:hypothetical protein